MPTKNNFFVNSLAYILKTGNSGNDTVNHAVKASTTVGSNFFTHHAR
jgi:hypothetical protein